MGSAGVPSWEGGAFRHAKTGAAITGRLVSLRVACHASRLLRGRRLAPAGQPPLLPATQ